LPSTDAEPRLETGPSTDAGERIYAIGDVHGCIDLLKHLLDRIGEHARTLPPTRSLYLILIGDVIDRGPHSADVLALLYDLHRQNANVITLLGNHEAAMLEALAGDVDAFRQWIAVGGAETLQSFGVEPRRSGEHPRDYLMRARRAIPPGWLTWLSNCPLSVRSGDYFFVHAGIRPGVALDRQTRQDMLWIREDFLPDQRHHGAVIVHGHTITRSVERRANRIGIDTGAYRSGVLSAIYLEGRDYKVIAASTSV
jgi:serine/threonine protein phosphatase 1